jgi:lipoic acid synthetase
MPGGTDGEEPERVAAAVAALGLGYAVVTSVTRDDLPDGGASVFAETVREIRKRSPSCRVEVLIPDFQGDERALGAVLSARPDVLNHNVETVPSLYERVRPQADYRRSVGLLGRAKAEGAVTKSGMMLGLGECEEDVLSVMNDLLGVGCDVLTLGQYLQPRRDLLPVARYYRPEEFESLRNRALRLGFRHVEAGPLVRSSYHAGRYGALEERAG